MIFKLGVIGHRDSLHAVSRTVKHTFDDVELYPIEFDSDEDIKKAVIDTEKILKICDGLLFTGIDPYKFISARLNLDLPVRYIAFSAPHFIKSLLKAVCEGYTDIYRVSVDTLSYSAVVKSYVSLGVNAEKLHLSFVNIQSNSEHYIHKVEDEHIRNYEEGRSKLCVTSITSVYNSLSEKNIPTTLITPDDDTYIYEIKNVMAKDEIRKKNQNTTATVILEFTKKDNFYISNDTQLSEAMENSKLMEYIAIFSQKLSGATFQLSQNQYIIYCNNKNLEVETDNYKSIEILSNVSANTRHMVSIGIGYGETAEISKKNATIAIKKAMSENRNVAYIASGSDHNKLLGPITDNSLKVAKVEIFEKRLTDIAEITHLSINTIYKIDCIIRQSDTKRFTSKELSEKLGVSLRTVNRTLSALNDNGYISYVARSIITKKGRPTSVFMINF